MIGLTGLYIHIPFCKSKCPYCDFNSYAGKMQYEEQYIKSLVIEAESFKGAKIDTIYIGGGTPTFLDTNNLVKIIETINKLFNIIEAAEFTIEANPATIDKEKLEILKESGVNRISIGVQSFNPLALKALGRIHSAEDTISGIYEARAAGIDNISIDLMFSLPGQTEEMWAEDLKTAVSFDISHISCYGLKIEEGTPFYNRGVMPLNEDTDRRMYHNAVDILNKNGFEQYEISNFARNKKYSKHNLLYWNCMEYIGLGAGAHSYLNGRRYNNIVDIIEYIGNINERKNIIENISVLSDKDKAVERLIMGLRLNSGIENEVFQKLECEDKIVEYIKEGFMTEKDGKTAFTLKGFDVSNYILSDLI